MLLTASSSQGRAMVDVLFSDAWLLVCFDARVILVLSNLQSASMFHPSACMHPSLSYERAWPFLRGVLVQGCCCSSWNEDLCMQMSALEVFSVLTVPSCCSSSFTLALSLALLVPLGLARSCGRSSRARSSSIPAAHAGPPSAPPPTKHCKKTQTTTTPTPLSSLAYVGAGWTARATDSHYQAARALPGLIKASPDDSHYQSLRAPCLPCVRPPSRVRRRRRSPDRVRCTSLYGSSGQREQPVSGPCLGLRAASEARARGEEE